MKKNILSIGFLLVSIGSGFSWSAPGHQAIAAAAFQRLNATAKKAIANIMTHSTVPELQDLASLATWPDDIRKSDIPSHSGHLVKIHDPNAKDFNDRFTTNRVWHFINYPLAGTYKLDDDFSSSEDVAHVIERCIDVLEGRSTDKWTAMHKDEALAWLVHLVGDIHQPLHVGEGFYEFDNNNALLITDPKLAMNFRNQDDAGGNELFYTKTEEFHAFWDKTMVTSVSPTAAQLITIIGTKAKNGGFSNSGDYHHWAESWATDSIRSANDAYAPLVHGEENLIGTHAKPDSARIDITLDTRSYKTDFQALARHQLGKGVFDLSELLNHIQWK